MYSEDEWYMEIAGVIMQQMNFLNEWLIFPVFMGNFNFFIGERENFYLCK